MIPIKVSKYYPKLLNEVKVYQNICCILDKNETDGNIIKIGECLNQIFSKEILYAAVELKKLK